MLSMRSVTWTCLLMQLVMSVACLVASMAVIAAKLQSVSVYEDKQHVSIEWWAFSCMSFAMILATMISMLGLSDNKKSLLMPHLFVLVSFFLFIYPVFLIYFLSQSKARRAQAPFNNTQKVFSSNPHEVN
ncbi:unnamed protein product [Angiostrongylus costaricensis]|uniref:G_PROTEIN_RECEP_F3_4 domain-containing protein n=1 Tax=Angiostrongylus costaricensis TaxID=334426 RepID=A0A0R3PSN6_ANGCS|nr:unnamed protein product [Angiostrongylus costaricensis]